MTARPLSRGSFTERVRQELARVPIGGTSTRRAELSAVLRLLGTLHATGGDGADPDRWRIEIQTTSGPLARRVYEAIHTELDVAPQIAVRAPGGVRATSTYLVIVTVGALRLGLVCATMDGDGRPLDHVPPGITPGKKEVEAYVRAAVLASGSFSDPGRATHFEIATGREWLAEAVAERVRALTDHDARVGPAKTGFRVVIKQGDAIARLLAATGAYSAHLEYEERRLRRLLRNEATRLANADNANLQRTVAASSQQVAAVQAAIDAVGWSGLGEDLRAVALARLANPESSLAELGELCDPPVGKSAVHRRLKRLEELGRGPGE